MTLTGMLIKHAGHSVRPSTEYRVPEGRFYGVPHLLLWCEDCEAPVWDGPVGARSIGRMARVDGPVKVGDVTLSVGDKVTGLSNDGRSVVVGRIHHFERDNDGIVSACVDYEVQRIGMFATLLDVSRLTHAHPDLPAGRR